MKYNYIQKLLSAAMLIAFTATSSSFATTTYGAYTSTGTCENSTSMLLSPQLTTRNEKITLSLRDSDVKQVLRMFADKVGMNVVFHSSVEGKVTLDLVNMPINDAFNLVLQVAGLNYYTQNNTLIVIAKDNADNAAFSKQEMMTFPIKYVAAAKVADFLNKNVFGMKRAGMSGVDAATVNAATNEIIVFGMPSDAAIVKKVIEQLDREPLTRTFAVNHTTPAEMADMICNLLLPSRGVTGGSSGSGKEGFAPPAPGVGTGGAAGIVTGGAASTSGSDSLKLGEGVVACTVSQTASSSTAPFDVQNLAVSFFPQRGTITIMGGSEAQAEMIEKFIKTNDIKQPQAYLEVQIVELNEQGSKEFQNQWSLGSKHWQANFDGTKFSGGRPGGKAWSSKTEYMWDGGSNGIYEMSGGVDSQPTLTGWTGGSPNGVPYILNGVLTVPNQIVRTVYSQVPSVHINWMMNYLIENQKARVLANPKLIITNGQESTIDLTQDYIEKVTSEFLSSAQNGAGATGTVQRTYTIGEDKGIKVALMPFISPEGYVTLNIKPEYATEAGRVYATGETGTQELQATLLSRRNLDLKNIRIKDNETLIIGGMVQEEESKTVHKIPLLGDLPLVGAAFRSTSTAKAKTELVIMITPKIINDGDGAVADNI